MKTALFALTLLGASLFAGDQSVTLNWQRSPDPEVSRYVVVYGNKSNAYHSLTNVGPSTVAIVNGLDSGTNWHFAIVAVSTNGLWADPSPEAVVSIPRKPAPVPTIISNWWNVPPFRLELILMPIK